MPLPLKDTSQKVYTLHPQPPARPGPRGRTHFPLCGIVRAKSQGLGISYRCDPWEMAAPNFADTAANRVSLTGAQTGKCSAAGKKSTCD